MNKIKKLQVYLEKVNFAIQQSTGEKKLFWQREARKTSNKIQELTK